MSNGKSVYNYHSLLEYPKKYFYPWDYDASHAELSLITKNI